jgi:hypothetical protein
MLFWENGRIHGFDDIIKYDNELDDDWLLVVTIEFLFVRRFMRDGFIVAIFLIDIE